jgi:predicted amidohydrolase/GNAT superfamily N-acetyltransferase
MSKAVNFHIRQATDSDIISFMRVYNKAYPVLKEENIVWQEKQLQSVMKMFPEGQFVAESDGHIVGAALSLIVDMGADPYRLHTWSGITDRGYFYTHTPTGDTLYGAEVFTLPEARGIGVGAGLYQARRELCQRLNMQRILIGGRLWNYDEHHTECTPEEYALRVVAGEIKDLVMSFQLAAGFQFKRILPDYLHDPKSLNNAALLEWVNPDYKAKPTEARKVRLAAVQYKMRAVNSFEEFAKQVRYFVDIAHDYEADFILFPELFTVQLLSSLGDHTAREGIEHLTNFTPQYVALIKELAERYDICIIGGSQPVREGDEILNKCLIALPNGDLHWQPKLHITPNERRWWGIKGGNTLQVIDTPRAKIGVLICYDVEFPEPVRYLADQGAEILFVPFCTDTQQGYLRVRHCAQARAIENQMYVAIAGNVGNLPNVANMDINYAQASVFTPSDFAFARDAVKAEADSNQETLLICDVDLDDLEENRKSGSVTPLKDRRKDLFQFVSTIPTTTSSTMKS